MNQQDSASEPWWGFLFSRWGIGLLLLVAAFVVFAASQVSGRYARLKRAVDIQRQPRSPRILVLMRTSSPRRAAGAILVALRQAKAPLRLSFAVHERIRDPMDPDVRTLCAAGRHTTAVDHTRQVQAVTVQEDPAHEVDALEAARAQFSSGHPYLCILSDRITRLAYGWDDTLCELAGREAADSAITSFPLRLPPAPAGPDYSPPDTEPLPGLVLFPARVDGVSMRRMSRPIDMPMPCVAASRHLAFLRNRPLLHKTTSADDARHPDLRATRRMRDSGAKRILLSPTNLCAVRELDRPARGAHGDTAEERMGMTVSRDQDPSAFVHEQMCKYGTPDHYARTLRFIQSYKTGGEKRRHG